MRRLQLRQRGFRPQGTPVIPKVVEPEVVTEDVVAPKKVVTPKKKKETVMSKVKKVVKKII